MIHFLVSSCFYISDRGVDHAAHFLGNSFLDPVDLSKTFLEDSSFPASYMSSAPELLLQ